MRALLYTVQHKLGNGLVPLSSYMEKISSGERLSPEEMKKIVDAYKRVEDVLAWIRSLDTAKIQSMRLISSKSGLLSILEDR